MKLEKGCLIEVKIPNIEKPVQAIIPTGEYEGDFSTTAYYTYILYAECQRGMNTSFTEDGEPISEIFENWSDLQYSGIITDDCEAILKKTKRTY